MIDRFSEPYGTKFLFHYNNQTVIAVFGNRKLEKIDQLDDFKSKKNCSLKQIHSANVIDIDQVQEKQNGRFIQPTEGDALFSKDPKKALMIFTADCIPLLVYNRKSQAFAAIHAGWRGLFAGVIENTLNKEAFIYDRENCLVFVGPHLRKENFEIKSDIFDQLRPGIEKYGLNEDQVIEPSGSGHKLNVDFYLHEVLDHLQISEENRYIDRSDTFASEDHFSYRKQGEGGGRLISAITIKNR